MDYLLTADWTGSKIVIPISTSVGLYTLPGSGGVFVSVGMIRPINDTATKRTITLTTTNRHILNNRGDLYDNQTATAGYTASGADLGATEWVELASYHTRTSGGSNTPLRNTSSGIWDNTIHINHLKDSAPIVLYKGASLSVQTWCAGT